MTNQSTKISDTMKNFKILAMTLCCILAMGFAACSDDDDAVKTALKDPALSNVSESVSSLTFSWDKVDNATQYGYELVDEAGEMVATDVTKGTSVKFTGLKPATTYTLSVWAYAPLYGEMSTSKIATLTGTTAATEPLAAPRPEATVAAGVVTVTWEEVPHATSYIYSYPVLDKATAETNIVTGETSDTSVTIEGLDLTAHTFTVYATSTDEAYTDSPEATVSFTISHDELYTVTGKYTSAHLGQTFDVTMVAYDDNTYTLFAWYGVDYYNFDFSVNADGVIVPNSSYALNSPATISSPQVSALCLRCTSRRPIPRHSPATSVRVKSTSTPVTTKAVSTPSSGHPRVRNSGVPQALIQATSTARPTMRPSLLTTMVHTRSNRGMAWMAITLSSRLTTVSSCLPNTMVYTMPAIGSTPV